jgi:hypothetical protein
MQNTTTLRLCVTDLVRPISRGATRDLPGRAQSGKNIAFEALMVRTDK